MTYGFYIYYRVPADVAEELRSRVLAMQETITDKTGTTGKLVTKIDEPLLWMEVYDGVHDCASFGRILEEAIAVSRLNDLLPAPSRKTEIFLF